jgi:hypothetical protein
MVNSQKCEKEALATPILKKGDPTKKENYKYKPVSCLSVESKVLEKHYMEMHKLLPENQHGFC